MRLLAICCAAVFLLVEQVGGAESAREVPIPQLTQPWEEAVQIVGGSWCNDFCLIKDRVGKWHCLGIGGQDGRDDSLFHAVGESLDKPFTFQRKISSGNHMASVQKDVRIQKLKWIAADPAAISKIIEKSK